MAGQPLVIIGAGGHAREALAILRALEGHEPGRWRFLGFSADQPGQDSLLTALRAPFLGPVVELPGEVPAGTAFLVGIGSGLVRARLQPMLEAHGMEPATLVHPGASVGPDVTLGAGSLVFPHAVITVNTHIGAGAAINCNSSVGHDGRWGSFVSITQNVAISGSVTLGDRATVYSGACVRQGVTVGPDAVVGACAFVNRDVPAGVTVVGVPARPLRGL